MTRKIRKLKKKRAGLGCQSDESSTEATFKKPKPLMGMISFEKSSDNFKHIENEKNEVKISDEPINGKTSDDVKLNDVLADLKSFGDSLLQDLEVRSQNMMMWMKREMRQSVAENTIDSQEMNNAKGKNKVRGANIIGTRKTHGCLRIKEKSPLGVGSNEKSLDKYNTDQVYGTRFFTSSRKEKEIEDSKFYSSPDIATCLSNQARASTLLMKQSYPSVNIVQSPAIDRRGLSSASHENQSFATPNSVNSGSFVQGSNNSTSLCNGAQDFSTRGHPVVSENQVSRKDDDLD